MASGVIRIKIGTISFQFVIEDSAFRLDLKKRYSRFISSRSPQDAIRIRVLSYAGEKGRLPGEPSITSSRNSVRINRKDFQYQGNYSKGNLEVWDNQYSFDSFLRVFYTVLLFKSKGGLLLHGAAVKVDGRGYIFLGRSGAGKTTISRMHLKRQVLTDELSLITPDKDGGFRVWSTPFWGEFGKGVTNTSVRLSRIYLIKKSTKWKTVPASIHDAVKTITRTILCFQNEKRVFDFFFDICGKLIRKIPICLLATKKQRKFPGWIYKVTS